MAARMGELITRWVKIGIGFVLIWVMLFAWNNLGCSKALGKDMDPTIKMDAFKLTKIKGVTPDTLVRDDIIFYEYEIPGAPQRIFCSRVVALPGQRVRIENGEAYVNDQKIDQSYVNGTQRSLETRDELVVPRDCVYVLCDNRREYDKWDSRGIGPIGAWAIIGKVK
jgi:signal peptidase I